jgi:hypothetical protein
MTDFPTENYSYLGNGPQGEFVCTLPGVVNRASRPETPRVIHVEEKGALTLVWLDYGNRLEPATLADYMEVYGD